MIVGCFTLHLYCDNDHHVEDYKGPCEYTGETRAEWGRTEQEASQ